MIANSPKIDDLTKLGRLTLPEARNLFADSASSQISVQDWQAFYNSDNGELSEYCFITQTSGGPPIVAAGMLAYSSDGKTLYFSHYTTGFNSADVWTSAATGLFSPGSATSMLGVVFGSASDGTTYFFERTLPIEVSQAQSIAG